jgi:hypothetical protein
VEEFVMVTFELVGFALLTLFFSALVSNRPIASR